MVLGGTVKGLGVTCVGGQSGEQRVIEGVFTGSPELVLKRRGETCMNMDRMPRRATRATTASGSGHGSGSSTLGTHTHTHTCQVARGLWAATRGEVVTSDLLVE